MRLTITALGLLSLLVALTADAAPDHLVCRRSKDKGPRIKYSADVVSAQYAGTGCFVKAPATLFCEEATADNFNPPPAYPQFHGRGNPGRFLCYKLKCPTNADTVTMIDPLG